MEGTGGTAPRRGGGPTGLPLLSRAQLQRNSPQRGAATFLELHVGHCIWHPGAQHRRGARGPGTT